MPLQRALKNLFKKNNTNWIALMVVRHSACDMNLSRIEAGLQGPEAAGAALAEGASKMLKLSDYGAGSPSKT
jgi:hypothetical protein